MPLKEMTHPNTIILRELEEKAKDAGWPWDRSFSYEVAVAADELNEPFPSDNALLIARGKLLKFQKRVMEE